MLTNNTPELAVRLYENKLYGSTYGKGLYRRALFNGSIDIRSPQAKYVVDLYNFSDWANQAQTPEQKQIVQGISTSSQFLYSWIFRYNPTTKQKTLVVGYLIFDLNTNEIRFGMQQDPADEAVLECTLNARPCKASGDNRRTPQLLATNTDLTLWQ